MPESRLPINNVAGGLTVFGRVLLQQQVILLVRRFLVFPHPNLPFLCVAGSYTMSECTGIVWANGCLYCLCVNCNSLGIC